MVGVPVGRVIVGDPQQALLVHSLGICSSVPLLNRFLS